MSVNYQKSIFVGNIIEIKDDEYKVKCMHRTGINSFKWPTDMMVCWYENIIAIIDAPEPINNRGLFKLEENDFEKYRDYMKNTKWVLGYV